MKTLFRVNLNLMMFFKCLWKCFECCKRIPIIFVVGIVSWSYYVYLFHFCYAFQFIPYHFLLFMFSWSFIKTAFTSIKKPPENFFLAAEKLHQLEEKNFARESRNVLLEASKSLPILCRNFSGAIRYCNVCRCFKPDRCHHCSICGKCVLKMDHHCPWVNNCVGYSNYKFFLLFLWYGLAYCSFISYSLYEMAMEMISDKSPQASLTLSMQLLFMWLLASLFALGLAILSIMHLYLMLVNKTTLEMFQATTLITGPKKKGFHLGTLSNFVQVFGPRVTLWPLPMHSSAGDGVSFPVNPLYASDVDKAFKDRAYSMVEEGLMQA